MRVVHLYDGHEQVYDGKGSVPGVVWNVARETAAAGHSVTILERQWDGLTTQAEHEGVTFRRLGLWTGADKPWTRVPYEMTESPVSMARLLGDRTYFALRALRELKELSFDVLHVHLPFAANVLLTIAPRLRHRTVYTAHLGELRLDALDMDADMDADVPYIVRRFSPDIFLAKRAAQTSVLNSSIRERFVERGVDPNSVSVVPNGVDIDRFANVSEDRIEAVREQYSLGDAQVVLFVGTVMPRKGVTDLVEAFAEATAVVNENVQLIIAGEIGLDETYTREMRSLITAHGLDDAVDVLGFVPMETLPTLYATADVCVVPSHEEGFGMTAVEAMAAGTPVVGTRVGGLPSIIEDGTHGYLVEVGAIPELAATISKAVSGKAVQEMASNASARAREFSWAGVTERFLNIYKTCDRRSAREKPDSGRQSKPFHST